MAQQKVHPQKVVPLETVSLPEGKKLGWMPMFDADGRPIGFQNPKFGLFRRIAVVNDKGEYLYDGIMQEDGPIDETTMQATPNAVIVPIEERPDGYYVHCHAEFRPVIRDHVVGEWGVEVLSIAGGFTKKGAKPSETALAELFEEEGIKVEEATMERIGYGSPNRAFVATCVEVWLAKFRVAATATPDAHESIHGNQIVRIDQFPLGPDFMVNSAIALAAKHLGCISAKPKVGLLEDLKKLLKAILTED